jgi:peptidoglycan hydrolase-like amidase
MFVKYLKFEVICMKIKVKVTTPSNMKYFKCTSGAIVEVELEDYVRCVVASEIGKAPLEACKAQAIACRTFACSRGVLDGKPISDDAGKAQAYIAARNYYDVCN